MAITYTDRNTKVILFSSGRMKAVILEAVETGDLLSWYVTDASSALQFADQGDSQAAEMIACEPGAAGDTITVAKSAVVKAPTTVGAAGAATDQYFGASTDFLGEKVYLGESGKPSSTQGTTFRQVVGRLLDRNKIAFDLPPTVGGVITETLTGATANDAWKLNITDATTNTSGYTRALYINTSVTGTKTSSGEHNSLGIDMAVSGDTPYAYIQSIYMSTSGNPTIGLASAISVYMDNMGTALSSQHILDLQTGNPTASAASTREAYIRFRNHGTGTPTSILFLQANNNAKVATNFIETGSNSESGPVAVSTTSITSGSNTSYRIRCLYGSTTFYLLGVAAS